MFFPAFVVWGYDFARAKVKINYPTRVMALLFGVFALSICFSFIPLDFRGVEAGGFVGRELARLLMKFINFFMVTEYNKIVVISI